MKVIDKIKAASHSHSNGGAVSDSNDKVVFSFEFFPPKTEDGVDNLFERMDRMVAHNPTFCDITWGAGGSTADLTLDIANKMQNMICVETMMHLTCTNMPVEKIDHALQTIKSNGIQNVLALRGDPPHGQDKFVQVEGGFACALDLVKHIRSKYGDYFGITVAGYPEAHPDMIGNDGLATPENYQKDLEYLKRKVDAGADLIVTQLFYDTDIFLKFVNDCRQIGINCPIVPGIMPINNYKGFLRMTGFCKTKIPAEITAALEPIKDNEEAVRAYGIHLGTEMCKKIMAHGIKTLHLYTLNMEKSALAILLNLGLIDEAKIIRPLPWRPPANIFRVKEGVRPIFWANRPKSYISRTLGWEQYPEGRWGDSCNPSYGALTDHQNFDSDGNGINLAFKKLLKQMGNPVEFELPEWFNKWKPTPYTFIKRNIYLTKRIKRRLEDDGIFCSCSLSPGSSGVCDRDCHCGMLLSSCSSGCKCGNLCLNKPFQHRPVKKMKLVQTEKCGAGIVADEDIKQGEFVIEYVGEVIDDKTCEERLWNMKHRGETNFYLCEINRDMVIDASYKGNKSRYINHSCSPNTEMQKWIIDGETRIGIFATRNIRKGEHLTYDYQFVQFGADQDCHCGAAGCRRKLGVKPSKPKMSSDAALKLVACQVAVSSPKLKAILSGKDVYQNGGLRIGSSQHVHSNRQTCSYNCIGEVIKIFRPLNERSFGMIKRFDKHLRKHAVMFEDGVVEFLDMSEEDWEFVSL